MITRLSHLFLRTLRDDPSDAEVLSHKLLVRAGYVRRIAPGVYSWLPLGLKVLNRIQQIVHEEQQRAGHPPHVLRRGEPRPPRARRAAPWTRCTTCGSEDKSRYGDLFWLRLSVDTQSAG